MEKEENDMTKLEKKMNRLVSSKKKLEEKHQEAMKVAEGLRKTRWELRRNLDSLSVKILQLLNEDFGFENFPVKSIMSKW
jgi:hypothetical protein